MVEGSHGKEYVVEESRGKEYVVKESLGTEYVAEERRGTENVAEGRCGAVPFASPETQSESIVNIEMERSPKRSITPLSESAPSSKRVKSSSGKY